jgi:hypothetical protein
MRTLAIATILALAAGALEAQDSTITIRVRDPRARDELQIRQLPRDVAEEVVRFFNGPSTVRFSGATRIPAGRGITGDVAILGGPVVVAGRVSGSLVVVNGDVTFERGAVVGGDVLVVGGAIDGEGDARVAGEIRAYRDPLRYRRVGDEIVYAPQRELPRWSRWRRWDDGRGSNSDFLVALGGTYNRVEGAPIHLGPRVSLRLNEALRLNGEAIGIFRTGRDFSFREGDFGYRARAELVFGNRSNNFGIGVRAFDQNASVEPWPLKDFEAGWGAFLLHRDYRDWFRREGAGLYGVARFNQRTSLTVEGREERHHSLDARDPWTLFRSDQPWRANPAVTDGRYRLGVATLRLDTRNDRTYPSSGWFITAEYELGEGRDVADTGAAWCFAAGCPSTSAGELDYRRVFFDARRYVRVSPAGRLNLRLAGGGRVGGDELPLQRRFALGYPDPLPGYDFREVGCGGGSFAGTPALCDRVLIAQAEFRTHLGFDLGPDWANVWDDADDDDRYEPFHVSGPDIVVFADAGRGWRSGAGADRIPSDKLPALRTFQVDLGLGLDFGPVGFYFARAVDSGDRNVHFTVRMGRRF